jgi:cell shape-determining protein MreC
MADRVTQDVAALQEGVNQLILESQTFREQLHVFNEQEQQLQQALQESQRVRQEADESKQQQAQQEQAAVAAGSRGVREGT